MGVITISMDDKSEKTLRESAKLLYGDKKDAISKTIVQAVDNLNNKREDTLARLRHRMYVNPIKVGKGGKMPKTRAEIYER